MNGHTRVALEVPGTRAALFHSPWYRRVGAETKEAYSHGLGRAARGGELTLEEHPHTARVAGKRGLGETYLGDQSPGGTTEVDVTRAPG